MAEKVTDLDRRSPFAAMESMNMDENVSVKRAVADRLLVSAKLLLQQMEGCITDHHALDLSEQGWPGWIADCRKDIETAATAISTAPASPPSSVGEEATFQAAYQAACDVLEQAPNMLSEDADEADESDYYAQISKAVRAALAAANLVNNHGG